MRNNFSFYIISFFWFVLNFSITLVMYNSFNNTTFLVMLLPHKPKQKYKFKTKN